MAIETTPLIQGPCLRLVVTMVNVYVVTLLLLPVSWANMGLMRTSRPHSSCWSSSAGGADEQLVPLVTSRRRFPFLVARGGYQEETQTEHELSLDEKVRKAMIKLGLTPPEDDDEEEQVLEAVTPTATTTTTDNTSSECNDAVCEMPKVEGNDSSSLPGVVSNDVGDDVGADDDAHAMAERLAADFGVDKSLAMAAIGATRKQQTLSEGAARDLLQQEIDRIGQVPEDSAAVQTLVAEGFDSFLARRALAFADLNLQDARAILVADQMDQQEDAAADATATEQEEEKRLDASISQQEAPVAQEMEEEEEEETSKPEADAVKTVKVDADIDPTGIKPEQKKAASPPPGMPPPANKKDVVFEATTAQIQELVFESPVPVLLDIYADWCGPCKVLGPALEEMAVQSGGVFRLVKVNSDKEKPVSGALEVTALPTVFGISNGRIVNMFQGMPSSEKAMQSFMMGLLLGPTNFDPPVSVEQKKQFQALTLKLIKVAGTANFSFSSRERLQGRIKDRLDELSQQTNDFVDAEESTRVLRSLLSNVLKDPFDTKYRTINLQNKVLAANVAKYPACLAILKSVGFRPSSEDNSDVLVLKQKVVNVAPLIIARDCIDKWVDQSRHEFAKAARKRKDEQDRIKVQQEITERGEQVLEEDEEEDVAEDPNVCTLKLRMDGKKKVHEISLNADDPLSLVLKNLPVRVKKGQEVQITCVAKRLVVKSTDKATMKKSLRELQLTPSASIVVAIGSSLSASKKEGSSLSASKKDDDGNGSSLSQRAAKQKKKKKGSHTMQSIGIYSKDDNNKAELIDGGGGTWYEHDVTDDEDEVDEKPAEEEGKGDEEEDESVDEEE